MKFFIFAMFIALSFSTYGLEIKDDPIAMQLYQYRGTEPTSFILEGPIEKGDLKKIENFLIDRTGKSTRFSISSPGGNVEEAINIGLLFRDTFMKVKAEKQCDSACFFIIAGAYNRSTSVPIGIHRPYFEPELYSQLSPKESEKAFSDVMGMVENYLSNIHISSLLIDGMMKASPKEMMYISVNDFNNLIGQFSINKQDWLSAKCDTRTSIDLQNQKLINEMSSYTRSLKISAQYETDAVNLFNQVQKLNKKYNRTIEAHSKDINLGQFTKEKLQAKHEKIRKCQNNTIKQQRENVLIALVNNGI